MLRRLVASVFASLVLSGIVFAVLVLPAGAQSCMTWQDGIQSAAEWSAAKNDRIAAVLLTPEESAATWAVLFPGGEPGPYMLGVMVSQSEPDKAFVAGFDPNGCVTGSGSLPFGTVLDAMTTAGVQSEFTIVEPAAPTEGA